MRVPTSSTISWLLLAVASGCGDAGGATGSASTTQPTTDDGPTPTSTGTDGASEVTTTTTDADGTSAPASASETSTAATAVTIGDTSGTTGPACAPNVCSDDLTQVLCDGEVVEVCSPGECVDGECVAPGPCAAAALASGSQGCEFWAVKTRVNEAGACFAVFVVNTWSTPVKLAVEFKGEALPVAQFARIPVGQGGGLVHEPYDEALGLPVGGVAVLSLSRGPGMLPDCPAPAAVDYETQVLGTGFGAAFRISSDFPIAAHQMLPYGGSVGMTSATLLLPTSAWGTNYLGVNAYAQGDTGGPLLVIVAAEDDTVVTIDPKVKLVGGGGVKGGPAGVPVEHTLARGQTMQVAQHKELTGSPIAANRPIAVFGGASCMNVPNNAMFCDAAHQQLPPIRALGSAYVAVRYRDRVAGKLESPPWRLVGVVDGTELTYAPAVPPGAPTTLALGEVAEFNAPGPFTVASQGAGHPFHFAGYMTGGFEFGGRGDPEWVNNVPPAQFLERYVFFTDPSHPETELVVVRSRVAGVFADVTLGCAGPLGGWQAVGPDHEWTRVDLVTGDFQGVGACSNGRHEMTSAQPFGVTVWGWGSEATGDAPFTRNVSYAYPGGAAIRKLNDVEVIPQ